jgi:two-component system NarL family response regulator
VLQLVAQGNRNKEIAGLLSIADETVRMHMKNILSKLAAHDRTHAVTIAVKRGVFQL